MKNSSQIILVDGNKSLIGGVETLNIDLVELHGNPQVKIHRSSLKELKQYFTKLHQTTIVFDIATTWSRFFQLSWLQLYFFLRSRKNPSITWIIREHHYCEYFMYQESINTNRLMILLKLQYKLFHKIIFVSHAQHNWAKQNKLITKAQTSYTIQHCPQASNHTFKGENTPSDKCRYGIFGRFCEQKGINILISSWLQIPECSNLSLLIGGYGEQEQQIIDLCSQSKNITFYGVVNTLHNFFAQIDYLIIPSNWEPFGIVATEAKAAGIPIIVSHRDGLPEQAIHCGWSYEINDDRSLANVIKQSHSVFLNNKAYSKLVLSCKKSWSSQRELYPKNLMEILSSQL